MYVILKLHHNDICNFDRLIIILHSHFQRLNILSVKGHWSLSTKEICLCTSITFALPFTKDCAGWVWPGTVHACGVHMHYQ